MSMHAILIAAATLGFGDGRGDDPWADAVVYYDPGSNPAPGYTTPSTALGAPERYTGEDVWPGVVSPFNPPWGLDEIVSLGAGGSLVLRFDTPVEDDPDNLHGIDLLVFGNAGFIDAAWPEGIVGGLFGNEGGTIEVSADGTTWHEVPTVAVDGLFPTQGWLDGGPYDAKQGTVPSDFTQPVDPALTLDDLAGLDHEALRTLYHGAGGGAGIDLAPTGLVAIQWVRISNPGGADDTPEIDALADVAPRLPGDVTLDGVVDVSDLLALIGAWGPAVPGGVPADLDGDGLVGVTDLLIVLANWTK